jgi:hypothetical protein
MHGGIEVHADVTNHEFSAKSSATEALQHAARDSHDGCFHTVAMVPATSSRGGRQ